MKILADVLAGCAVACAAWAALAGRRKPAPAAVTSQRRHVRIIRPPYDD